MKARLSTEWLSGCSGCHVAVVDLHEKLLGLVEDVDFVRATVLMDEKHYPDADIGIVEGAIRSEHDRHALLEMRKSVKTLVAFGSCAVYGGPSGLGWLHGKAEVIEKVYGSGPTNAGGERPDASAPVLEESVVPIDEVVPVDFYLPGCPPHPYFIAAGLRALLGASGPPLSDQTVCAECTRQMRKVSGVSLKRGAVTALDPSMCFLSQGVVCMGSVSLNRCQAPCPAVGIACTGCCGPSLSIVTEPHLDMRTMLARRMSMLCGIAEAEVREYIERDAKTFYAYAVASPVMYKKPTVELREWAGEPAGSGPASAQR
ncbi:MAG: methyl viologen-reducing hydrogenase [Acidobacteriota bacterium]